MKVLLFYTDPGSGMMLLQVLLAFVGGVVFYFRKFFYKLFGKNKAAAAELPDAEEDVFGNSTSTQKEV